MKKFLNIKLFYSLILMILILVVSISCKNRKTKITICEVAHSVFYAPLYVAIELDYFNELGIEIELVNGNGADKVMAALLSKDAQIGLMGPEASLYVYLGGQENYAINFAQLTRTDGSFIVGREKIDNFTLQDLKGKSILGGRKGGVPEMTLEYILKQSGLIVGQDDPTVLDDGGVLVRTDVQFAAMAGAFSSGEADFTTLFEPTATNVVNNNKGYILASVGQYTGEIPYTAFCALKNYINENEEIIQTFTDILYRAQLWVLSHSAREVAEAIHPQFTSNTIEELTIAMEQYKLINAWSNNPFFSELALENLMKIMIEANELDKNVLTKNIYKDIVTTKYALNSMNN